MPDSKTSEKILKTNLKLMGNQCNDLKIGVVCALCLVVVSIWAAAFCWPSCRKPAFFGRPNKRAL